MYPRIDFMDLEGTLLQKVIHLDNGKVAPSAWTLLAERLGPDALAEEEATKDRWNNGGYGHYVEWMQDSIRIHQRYGLTRAIFEGVIASVQEMPGARQAVQTFREHAAITVIISGGFKALADRIQQAFKIDHALSGCEYFFDPEPVLGAIEAILRETLHRRGVYRRVKALLQQHHVGDQGAHGHFEDRQTDQ